MERSDVSGLAGEKPLRVVHIIIGLNVGGAELMLKRLILEQRTEPEIEHIVISLTDHGTLGDELRHSGIQVEALGMRSFFGALRCFYRLRRRLLILHPDIVHTWMYHSDLLGGLAARSLGLRNIIWCVRSTDINKGGSKLTLLIRNACAILSGILPIRIVYAAEASRKVHEKLGYKPEKSQVIPNGFDLSRLSASDDLVNILKENLGIQGYHRVVISVGRYSPVKDHLTFIQAAAELAQDDKNLRFLMVGRDLTSDNSALMNAINLTGYAEQFILAGERNDIPCCLKASDIFCLHSVTEGFPNVLGEAMAMGVPSVTTDVGDASFLIGMRQYVVPAKQPVQLAQCLRSLLSMDFSERKKLGLALQKRIKENFSMHSISQKYLNLYQKINNG